MTSTPTREQILDDLRAMLRNFNGREYDGEITRETRFVDDLGMASIDAVILGETLEEHYGRQLPFQRVIAERPDVKVTDIRVGDLIDFLYDALREPVEAES